MAHKRGSRWVASGYDRSKGRKIHLGTFSTRREAVCEEADWKLAQRISVSDAMVEGALAECRRWGLLEESEFRADNDAQESVLRCALEVALRAVE